jgi:hypothetical protein
MQKSLQVRPNIRGTIKKSRLIPPSVLDLLKAIAVILAVIAKEPFDSVY